MSAPYTIPLSWPSLCQKLSKLVEISRSSDENNFDCFFETRCILLPNTLKSQIFNSNFTSTVQ